MSNNINNLYKHIINLSNDPFPSVKEIGDCFNFILNKILCRFMKIMKN